MPWPWQLVTYCMDLRSGTIINWPRPNATWQQNEQLLEGMKIVWRTRKHVLTTKDPRYKWTEDDLKFDELISEGKPELKERPSPYELWLAEQNHGTTTQTTN